MWDLAREVDLCPAETLVDLSIVCSEGFGVTLDRRRRGGLRGNIEGLEVHPIMSSYPR